MEPIKTFRKEQFIRTADCDLMSTWRPSAILETMQETAGEHCLNLGVSRMDLLPMGLVWIITRGEVVMDRYPIIGETITIETSPMPVRRWFFPRYYLFKDAHGEIIGKAGSIWALLDLNSRHMVSPEAVISRMPDNSDLIAPLPFPATVRDVDGTVTEETRFAQYTDLDANCHVNNTKYLDWCCNALGVGTMQENVLSRFLINYNQEIRPGEEIQTALRRSGNEFSYTGIGSAGTCHFDIGGELRERQ